MARTPPSFSTRSVATSPGRRSGRPACWWITSNSGYRPTADPLSSSRAPPPAPAPPRPTCYRFVARPAASLAAALEQPDDERAADAEPPGELAQGTFLEVDGG